MPRIIIAISWKQFVGLRPSSELDRMAHDAETSGPSDPDPELSYYQGSVFAYVGKKDAAFHMLKMAIEQNYCAYSNLLSDPLLRGLHSDRQFDELLTAAHACQQAVQSASTPRATESGTMERKAAANSSPPAQSIKEEMPVISEHEEKSRLSALKNSTSTRMKPVSPAIFKPTNSPSFHEAPYQAIF